MPASDDSPLIQDGPVHAVSPAEIEACRRSPNRTAAPRRVLYLTFNKISEGDHYESYFADKLRSYPPHIERAPGATPRYRV